MLLRVAFQPAKQPAVAASIWLDLFISLVYGLRRIRKYLAFSSLSCLIYERLSMVESCLGLL